MPRIPRSGPVALLLLAIYVTSARAQVLPAVVTPDRRTADMPDSWLVLYNASSAESAAWAAWYAATRGIPSSQQLGVAASYNEHLPDRAAARAQILDPVRDYFSARPDVEQRIMGIVVGYLVPGTYGTVPAGPPGGYAIANCLSDMTNDSRDPNWQNPEVTGVFPSRLTKSTLPPGHYLVGRIDAASSELARALTLRALEIENPRRYFNDDFLWFDYRDEVLPGGEWPALRRAVEDPPFRSLRWKECDDDLDQTPLDAIRFGTHDTVNWADPRLYGEPRGSRILAFNFNSWGATTVRDHFAEGGRYVPNAIRAGYAAAIGATAEPASLTAPYPGVLLEALRRGWTFAEAMYLANPYDDWVWIGVGDPLLHMPHWFDEVPGNDPVAPSIRAP